MVEIPDLYERQSCYKLVELPDSPQSKSCYESGINGIKLTCYIAIGLLCILDINHNQKNCYAVHSDEVNVAVVEIPNLHKGKAFINRLRYHVYYKAKASKASYKK